MNDSTFTSSEADREKRIVALTSVMAAILLTTLKIAVGVATGSLGILSEAAHSGLDLVAALVTLWAVRISGKPADREHTYGHGKFENLSALFETLLLLITCVWIFYEVVHRLFFVDIKVEASAAGFAILIISIVVDFSRSRALAKVAKKYGSQALEADALHFSTDIWSSLVVLFGLVAVFVAQKLGIPWLEKADSIAAAIVACIVIWVSIRLGKKTIDDLLDAVPRDLKDKVDNAARVSGVIDVRKVRIRRSGPEIFADVTLEVGRETDFERAHDIATEAELSIRQALSGADVVVHVEPSGDGKESLLAKVRLVASRHGMGVHNLRVHEAGESVSIELHLEVEDSMRVGDAHSKVTQFEKALSEAIPCLSRIVSHIEPGSVSETHEVPTDLDETPVRAALQGLFGEGKTCLGLHDLKVQRVMGEIAVSFHCTVDSQIPILEAHDLTEKMERMLRDRISGIGRVTIHVEPPDDSAAAQPNNV